MTDAWVALFLALGITLFVVATHVIGNMQANTIKQAQLGAIGL